MAATAPMRDGPPAGSGTGGDSRVTTTSSATPAAAATTTTNFEYDESEWDIGIGNLIIDLDADIEKTNEKSNVGNLTTTSAANPSSSSGTSTSAGTSTSGAPMAAASSANAANSGSGNSSGSSGGKSGKSGGGAASSGASASVGGANPPAASNVEHSAVVDKGLKMKIKRTTKSGGKSSEKHEIVKPSEQNGSDAAAALCGDGAKAAAGSLSTATAAKHSSGAVNAVVPIAPVSAGATNMAASANCLSSASAGANSVKRGSGSSHRRDKTKEKHPPGSASDKPASSKPSTPAMATLSQSQVAAPAALLSTASSAELNGIVRPSVQRVMYPMQTNGPGPPNAPGPPPSPSKEQPAKPMAVAAVPAFGAANVVPATCATAPQTSCSQVTATPVATNALAASLSQAPSAASTTSLANCADSVAGSAPASGLTPGIVGPSVNSAFTPAGAEDSLSRPESPSSPPCKKLKTANCLINDNKETKDACVGTSISTMTEPDCLGPCEPGTSVTLEGIVWHETEGVLVVNVTWRGKTYVGTLLDCTRHDWAPPRFCDSPTSDLDARLPKGRAKRGRAATNDLSNFTETRSSVHSKLRSSSNGSNKSARKGPSNSPTPFVPPRPDSGGAKRKSRPADDESPSPQAACKKSKPPQPAGAPASPPATTSPVFYECPESNCCKKYRHINGLKYHQSHAHGGCADDDDVAKESGSMSENEELPSPIDQQAIKCERKDENSESEPATPLSEPAAPLNPSSPHQSSGLAPELEPPPVPVEPSPPPVDNKTVVKPGVLRYGLPAVDDSATSAPTSKPPATSASTLPGLRPPSTTLAPSMTSAPAHTMTSPSPPIAQPIPLSPGTQPLLSFASQHLSAAPQPTPSLAPSTQSLPLNPTPPPKLPQFKVKPASALLQDDKCAKEKTAKLQAHQQRKKSRKSPAGSPHSHHSASEQSAQFKMDSSSRDEVRSPAYSDISDDGAPVLEAEVSDAKKAPLPMDKKSMEVSGGAQSPHAMQHYNNMYAFYTQPPFLVPSVQPDAKPKEEKLQESAKLGLGVSGDKELKKESEMAQTQKLMPSHYFPYDYVTGYGYANYPLSMVAQSGAADKEIKDENSKSPGPTDLVKQPSASLHGAQMAQYSSPASTLAKTKMEQPSKMAGDAYSGVKERADARSPLGSSSYLQARQQQQAQLQHQQQLQQQQLHQQQMQHHQMQAHAAQPSGLHHVQSAQQQQMQQQLLQQQQQAHHLAASHQPHDDMRRYFSNMFPEQQPQQRRKESLLQQPQQHASHAEAPLKATPPPNAAAKAPSAKHKEKPQPLADDKKEEKAPKQEGVKPTMETQGPPPPPTSSYYFPSHYLQAPYHSPIAFDQAHMYRGMSPMMVPTGPYGNSPYLHHPGQMHAQISRYHAPEDLSRPPSGSSSKALDMLHQASQYYPSSHKIHELQERAIKSPTPKAAAANASTAAAANGQPASMSAAQLAPSGGPDRLSASGGAQAAKNSAIDGKDSRSPPPQRHVHTHHHTHVGLGYPLLPGQYPAPYQAAVLASEQAAGVASTGSNPYSPK